MEQSGHYLLHRGTEIMDIGRLESLMERMAEMYTELAMEIGRLRKMEEAQDDTLARYQTEVTRIVKEKNKIIQDLQMELRKYV